MVTNRRVIAENDQDVYTTPYWATQLLLDNERFDGPKWECCAGVGNISKVLLDNGYTTFSSDLYDHGRLDELPINHTIFVGTDALTVQEGIDNIITNPPYSKDEEFIELGLRCATKKAVFFSFASFAR